MLNPKSLNFREEIPQVRRIPRFFMQLLRLSATLCGSFSPQFIMQKILLSSTALLVLSVVACTAPTNPEGETTGSDSSSSSVASTTSASSVVSSAETSDSASSSSDSSAVSDSSIMESSSSSAQAARVVEILVTDWSFTPSTITAKKGELLELRLVVDDGEHSFTSQALGLDVPLAEGETTTVTIPTDATGTFSFRCAVPCGPGHKDMVGEIVITE